MTDDDHDLPRGWLTVSVAQVGSVRLGRQRSPDKHTGQYATKYLRAANITPTGLDLSDVLEMDFTPVERELFRLRTGDVVLSEASGSAAQVGRAALWRDEIPNCCFQNTVIRFRPHAAIADYALLVFQHYADSGAFAEASRGVGIQHLGAARFADMPFPLPPLAEQRRIAREAAERFRDLEAAEAALRDALARNLEQDRAIVAAAVAGELVETEAAVAAREGRPFEDASSVVAAAHQGSDEDELRLFGEDEANVHAEGESVPLGWVLVRVDRVGEVRLGRQRAPEHESGDHPTAYLRAANVTVEGLDLADVLRMNFTPDERKTFALRPGDIVLAEASGSPLQVGRAALWSGEIPGCCYQNTIIRFRPKLVLSEYALIVFRDYFESGRFARVARGVGIQHLGGGRFAEMGFPLPPPTEQTRIVEEARARLAASRTQRAAMRASLERFAGMRRELLAAAIGGRLVDQDHHDEPAIALLARLGVPPTEATPRQRAPTTRTDEEMIVTQTTRRRTSKPALKAPLTDVLQRAQRPLGLPELFAGAGYDRDSTEDVERFYIALRAELGRTVHKVGHESENALVEFRDAP